MDRMSKVIRFFVLTVFAVISPFHSVYADERGDDCTERIDSLLFLHDRCERGYQNPDSTTYYTVTALQLAESCFGFDSKEYSDIYTDYMIHDWRENKQMLLDYIYPIVAQHFNPFTSWVWHPYYRLGTVMEDCGELDKAHELFEKVIMADTPQPKRIMAKIHLQNIKQQLKGGNLENMLEPLVDEIRTISDIPERAEASYLLASSIADYYYKEGNYEKALEFVGYGECLEGHVSSRKMIMLLDLKYHILLESDHIAAIECLDKAIEIAESDATGEDDSDWLAMALVARGDYALSEQLDFDTASHYYLMANNLNNAPMSLDNPVTRSILRRLMYMLSTAGQYDEAINLGENLVATICRHGVTETSLWYIADLADVYLKAGQAEKAKDLLSKYSETLEHYPEAAQKINLEYAKYLIAEGNEQEAIGVLISLLANPKIKENTKMWAERSLAKAYTQSGDVKMRDASDAVNLTTKRHIASQLLSISPLKRYNWLDFCEEAIDDQLELTGNDQAVKNAAELNLFKKSLLFRTSHQIEGYLSQQPETADLMNDLKKMKLQLQSSMTSGDSISTANLRHKIDETEQRAVNLYTNPNFLLPMIDVNIHDVCKGLDNESVAVDFYCFTIHNRTRIGAFVLNKKNSCQYIDILEYDGEMPHNLLSVIWAKLFPMIQGYKNVYFCSDGNLNSLALEYAILEDGRHIDDLFSLHRVFHLTQLNGDLGLGDEVVFVGVSDHNSPYHGASVQRGNWIDLPNVMEELNVLKQNIPTESLTVYLDNTSTEEEIKKLDNKPVTTLHFSTHGVFRDAASLQASADSIGSEDYHIARRMATIGKESVSALIMRRGNLYWHAPLSGEGEDDLLTSEEIELMNFPKLNLTVLSACDTGLGAINPEGVWGLQRAFRIAGTKSLICSLTKVDDYWTAQFMDAFYQHAAKGNSIYDAFQKAQKWLRHELPDNPEVWSAFILIE